MNAGSGFQPAGIGIEHAFYGEKVKPLKQAVRGTGVGQG